MRQGVVASSMKTSTCGFHDIADVLGSKKVIDEPELDHRLQSRLMFGVLLMATDGHQGYQLLDEWLEIHLYGDRLVKLGSMEYVTCE